VRIVIQDPLDAAAYSIPASYIAVPVEPPLGRAQVPLASVGVPSGWASAVAQRTGGSGSLPLGGLPLPGHHLMPPPRASLLASPVTLATTAPSSRTDPATPVVSTVARVATANRLPLAPPVPDSLLSDTSVEHGSAIPFVGTYPVEHWDSILGIYLCTCCMFCTCVYLICWSRSGHSLLG